MEHKDLERLKVLWQKNADPTWVNGDLYRLMYRQGFFLTAYERLKSNPGNMTPGPDGSTLDGFSMPTIENIVNQMRDESFKFSRARRVHIPKAKGGTRPLGIAPPRDKVVQEVMRMILEGIYDSPHGSSFSQASHGFRPGRGCHTALKAIRDQWNGVTWIIEGDVKAAFDNVDHDILIQTLRKRISDERFLRLVRKALTAGYYEFRTPINSVIGTPQGSVLSPILCNVYLNELDQFCEELSRKHTRGAAKTRNPDFRRFESKIRKARKQYTGATDQDEKKVVGEEIRRLTRGMMEVSPVVDDGTFIRVKYLRYADDFVIGVNGPRALAEEIRSEVAGFMSSRLSLTLSLEKTHIRHAKTEEAFFLGTRIRIGADSPRLSKVERNGLTFTKRVAGWTPVMLAPVTQLVARLHSKGFCDTEGTPKAKAAWANLDDDQIITMFNSVLTGLLNYYSFVDNYAKLGRIQYILKFSAAKTLAAKHRRTMRQTFRKYGDKLTVKTTDAKGKERITLLKLERKWARKPNRFLGREGSFDPDTAIQFHYELRSRSKLGAHCAICGAEEDVVMHHVRHIRKMGETVRGFNRVLSAVNRKQIPVCTTCHGKVHKGEYDGISLKDLHDPGLAAR